MVHNFKSIREAKETLQQIEVDKAWINKEIEKIVFSFNQTYMKAKPPARLLKARGRGFVWRVSTCDTPNNQNYFTFTSVKAKEIFVALPAVTLSHYLELEEKRAMLNMNKKLLESHGRLVNEWINQTQARNDFERSLR